MQMSFSGEISENISKEVTNRIFLQKEAKIMSVSRLWRIRVSLIANEDSCSRVFHIASQGLHVVNYTIGLLSIKLD